MDEPTANLDPEVSKTVRGYILEHKKEKRTIILNTHLLDEAEKICDRVGILKTKMIVVDNPKRLKKSLWGRKTIFQLVNVNDEILNAVRQVRSVNVERVENKLIIGVNDPEKENPYIVNAILAAGGRIQFVTDFNPSLEDVYLKLVRS